MKKYQYLLFDADNTLFDFSQAEYLSFTDMCSVCDVSYTQTLYEQYSAINDSLWKLHEQKKISLEALKIERFRRLLLSNGYDDNDLTTKKAVTMRDCYMAGLAEKTCLIDGAEDICRKLSEKYDMYIVTNGIGWIQRSRFGKSALVPYFRDMFISEEIGVGKPSGEYYDYVLRKIGCADKSAYLALGDSITSDCTGAVNYGLDICYFNPKKKPNEGLDLTYTIQNLSELEAILL